MKRVVQSNIPADVITLPELLSQGVKNKLIIFVGCNGYFYKATALRNHDYNNANEYFAFVSLDNVSDYANGIFNSLYELLLYVVERQERNLYVFDSFNDFLANIQYLKRT